MSLRCKSIISVECQEDSSFTDSEGSDVGFEDEEYDMVDDDSDMVDYDSDVLWNEKESSDVEGGEAKLDCYPKFKPRTDYKQLEFAIGMLFSSREELKDAIDTYTIKNARDIKYVKNEKGRVRAVCKDGACKWFIYAKRLSGEVGLQIRKWQLTGIPCKHACAALRFSHEDVEQYVHECYSIATYKAVYAHSIKPMSGSDLWPQTNRVSPLPPPLAPKKAGRLKRLRRVNPIEVEDQGKLKICKVRKYLCKICKEQGHNSRACKKKATNVEQPVVQQPAQEEFLDAPFELFSQPSSQIAAPIPSQTAAPSTRPQNMVVQMQDLIGD